MRLVPLCLCSLLAFSPLVSEESLELAKVQADLKDPSFSNGTLSTTSGGIIEAPGMRIQAKELHYINTEEDGEKIQRVVAKGSLLFAYKGRFFVGDELYYDFREKTGLLIGGRTAEGIWFIGGKKVILEKDGTYKIEGAFVTTSENIENTWDITASAVVVQDKALLQALDMKLNIIGRPVLWLPTFKTNLTSSGNSPIKYQLAWDKGVGPRVTFRYRLFAWKDLGVFFRMDYRLGLGPGAALETEYFSKDKRTAFITRSYGAYDKLVYDEHGLKRYRLQGHFQHKSADGKTAAHLTYDKFRDLKMVRDFSTNDFEMDTQERTRFLLTHHENLVAGSLAVEPRVNNFQSINQQLPLIKIRAKPLAFGQTGILMDNYVSGGYLDYLYASDLLDKYPFLRRPNAGRVESRNSLYRPFNLGPVHFTPSAGVIGLFYSNSEANTSIGQGSITYGGNLHTRLYKRYKTIIHEIQPYAELQGITAPKFTVDSHYVFDIQDGLHRINSLKVGLKNTLTRSSFFAPNYSVDLYTYGFLGDTPYRSLFPKGYLSLSVSNPSYYLFGQTCWNFEEGLLDYLNFLSEFTVNENAAFAFEFRHRSEYDLRKSDHENFLVDMARPLSEVVASPLSDRRNTILGRCFLRLSPKWSCQFTSHFGWGREKEPSYSSFSIDAVTLLSAKWQLQLSYSHTTNDDRVGVQIQLAK